MAKEMYTMSLRLKDYAPEMTMFREKKVFRLEKKKVRNDLNKKTISQVIGRNIVISGAFQKLNKNQIPI